MTRGPTRRQIRDTLDGVRGREAGTDADPRRGVTAEFIKFDDDPEEDHGDDAEPPTKAGAYFIAFTEGDE